MLLGVQLYTLREHTQTLSDLAETLKKVADMGYTSVQISGTCPYDTAWMAEQLRCNGLTCAVTHSDPQRVLQQTDSVMQEHRTLPCAYIGIGAMPAGASLAQRTENFIQAFRPAARQIQRGGLYLVYHNHNFEFEKIQGVRVLDRLIESFLPQEMGFTVDTYWVQAGGADPAAWIANLSGRVPCVHFKDMAIQNAQQRMAPIGQGNMDFERILAACETAHTEYVLVEQDDCYGEDPFACLEKSFRALCALGLS